MYILVSQGIVIYTTDKLADALEKKDKWNKDYLKYKERSFEADNSVYLYIADEI